MSPALKALTCSRNLNLLQQPKPLDSASKDVECISIITCIIHPSLVKNRTNNNSEMVIDGHMLKKPSPHLASETYDSCIAFKRAICICFIR